MKCYNGAHQRGDVHHKVHVVGLNKHGSYKFLRVKVGEKVENVLEVVKDLVV